MDTSGLFRHAIAAAKAGQRAQARALLLDVVDQDPQNELAWLWLSDQLDDMGDRIAALEHALAINPSNVRVRERVENFRQERQAALDRQSAQLQERFQRALKAHKAGQQKEALALLVHYVQEDERNEQAWLLLSHLAPDIKDQIVALENALTLNPDNAEAKSRLARLQQLQQNPLRLGEIYEEKGETDKAIAEYLTASRQARSPAERAEANRRFEAVQNRPASPDIKPVRPALTVARLAIGPALLYGFMILVQSGLDPLRLSPLWCLGGVGVLLGSLLIAMTSLKPTHPVWDSIARGLGGESEPIARITLVLMGCLILLVLYALFFLSTVERLDVYRASLH
jgi:hypothetical protein